jgi:hypothetical protein
MTVIGKFICKAVAMCIAMLATIFILYTKNNKNKCTCSCKNNEKQMYFLENKSYEFDHGQNIKSILNTLLSKQLYIQKSTETFLNNSTLIQKKGAKQLNINSLEMEKPLEKLLPSIVVGIMVTEHTPMSTLKAFQSAFQNTKYLLEKNILNLTFFFVQGKSKNVIKHSNVVVLDIHENLNEGKIFHWFRFAALYLQKHAPYHPLNGIVKMDTDVAVDWNKFAFSILPTLTPDYYVGRMNNHYGCGTFSHCPPVDCVDFVDHCWIYMSGGWYALSLDMALQIVLKCPYAEKNQHGYEDVQTGTWVKNCISNPVVFHVENGVFFCHSSSITEHNILNMSSSSDCRK